MDGAKTDVVVHFTLVSSDNFSSLFSMCRERKRERERESQKEEGEKDEEKNGLVPLGHEREEERKREIQLNSALFILKL